jgi:hypothetical protein
MTTRIDARLGYVPHFHVTTLDGRRVRYEEIRERRSLVLVTVRRPTDDAGVSFTSRLLSRRHEFAQAAAVVVVTADVVATLPPPTVLVADRWGEILHLDTRFRGQPSTLLDVDELLSWAHFARIKGGAAARERRRARVPQKSPWTQYG